VYRIFIKTCIFIIVKDFMLKLHNIIIVDIM